MTQSIFAIPAFQDNYIWTLFDDSSKQAWVVDPGEASPVIETCKQNKLELAGILITHHHRDHTGGVAELLKHWKNIPVYGSDLSSIQYITHPLTEGDKVDCGQYHLQVLDIPGHTLDHIAFYNNDMLFCGDTLFSAGCGRVFEGTPSMMYESLMKLVRLPNDIKMFCGHEYTIANLDFAQHVEPNNQHITERMQTAKTMREQNLPTLPSIMSIEKNTNPFLRCSETAIIKAVEEYAKQTLKNPVDVFAHLREWKNHFLS